MALVVTPNIIYYMLISYVFFNTPLVIRSCFGCEVNSVWIFKIVNNLIQNKLCFCLQSWILHYQEQNMLTWHMILEKI